MFTYIYIYMIHNMMCLTHVDTHNNTPHIHTRQWTQNNKKQHASPKGEHSANLLVALQQQPQLLALLSRVPVEEEKEEEKHVEKPARLREGLRVRRGRGVQ